MPVMLPFMNSVALAGSTKFILYNILDDKFQENTDFTSVSYTGIQAGSLTPGNFNHNIYPDQRPCMAMYLNENGQDYEARMFVLSTRDAKREESMVFARSANSPTNSTR